MSVYLSLTSTWLLVSHCYFNIRRNIYFLLHPKTSITCYFSSLRLQIFYINALITGWVWSSSVKYGACYFRLILKIKMNNQAGISQPRIVPGTTASFFNSVLIGFIKHTTNSIYWIKNRVSHIFRPFLCTPFRTDFNIWLGGWSIMLNNLPSGCFLNTCFSLPFVWN